MFLAVNTQFHPQSQTAAHIDILSVSMGLALLDHFIQEPFHIIQEPFMIQFSMSCFFSFNMMFLRSTHEVVCIRSSFLFLHEQYSAVWIHHILFFHSSTEPYNMKSFVLDFFHIAYDSKIHLYCSISFLLLLNDIPLYGYGIFTCSSVYGDLSCCNFLVTMKNAAMNIHLQGFVWTFLFIYIIYI